MDRANLPPDFALLQVTPRLDGGGVEAITLDVALAMAAAGYRSFVASQGGALEGSWAGGGAELVRLPVHSRNPLRMAVNAARLTSLVRREAISLIHVRSRAPAFSALWAARLTRTPVVATYHGIYSAKSPLKRWYNGVMTRGDLVIANSEFTRRHILEQHPIDPSRVVIVPEGIDTDRFDAAGVSADRVATLRRAWGLEVKPSATVILQAARLTEWKGQRVMIEALSKLGGSREIVLVLAGRPETERALAGLRAAAASAGLQGKVRFVGAVHDMPAAYLVADLVVAPSIAPESFGRGVAEACAMGRPVLASRLGATAETVADGQTGWLVAPGDGAAWASAIKAALDMPPEARRTMGVRARTRMTRLYSLTAMCEATFALYRQVIDARR